jgi:hypothetical protein
VSQKTSSRFYGTSCLPSDGTIESIIDCATAKALIFVFNRPTLGINYNFRPAIFFARTANLQSHLVACPLRAMKGGTQNAGKLNR